MTIIPGKRVLTPLTALLLEIHKCSIFLVALIDSNRSAYEHAKCIPTGRYPTSIYNVNRTGERVNIYSNPAVERCMVLERNL
jgi:hypothetical protein